MNSVIDKPRWMLTEHKAEWRNYSDTMWNWYDEFPDEWTAWRTVTPGTSEKAIKLRLKEDKIVVTDELKPCPFCGSEAKLMKMDYEGGEVWGVFCKDDLAAEYSHGHYIDNYMTAESAIAAWNRRAETVEPRTCKRFWTGADMICSECGHQLNDPTANYCKTCGAKVVSG